MQTHFYLEANVICALHATVGIFSGRLSTIIRKHITSMQDIFFVCKTLMKYLKTTTALQV